jgi:hypothetical protein
MLEVCTGRNFRILPSPARGAFGPNLKFTHTPPEPDFLFLQPEWSPIYLQYALTIVSLVHFSFNACMPVILGWIIKWRWGYFGVWGTLQRYRMPSCKVLCRTISGREQLWKSPRKSSRWDLFPEPDCVTSIRWAQLRLTFTLRKKNGPRKPEIFYATFDCYNLNQTRTRPGSEHYLCYQARPSGWVGPRPEGQARACADL